jgi:hypothetical protein
VINQVGVGRCHVGRQANGDWMGACGGRYGLSDVVIAFALGVESRRLNELPRSGGQRS